MWHHRLFNIIWIGQTFSGFLFFPFPLISMLSLKKTKTKKKYWVFFWRKRKKVTICICTSFSVHKDVNSWKPEKRADFTLESFGQLHGLHQLLCDVEGVEPTELLLPEELRGKQADNIGFSRDERMRGKDDVSSGWLQLLLRHISAALWFFRFCRRRAPRDGRRPTRRRRSGERTCRGWSTAFWGSVLTLLLGWLVTLVTGCLKMDAVCLTGSDVFRSGLPCRTPGWGAWGGRRSPRREPSGGNSTSLCLHSYELKEWNSSHVTDSSRAAMQLPSIRSSE